MGFRSGVPAEHFYAGLSSERAEVRRCGTRSNLILRCGSGLVDSGVVAAGIAPSDLNLRRRLDAFVASELKND